MVWVYKIFCIAKPRMALGGFWVKKPRHPQNVVNQEVLPVSIPTLLARSVLHAGLCSGNSTSGVRRLRYYSRCVVHEPKYAKSGMLAHRHLEYHCSRIYIGDVRLS